MKNQIPPDPCIFCGRMVRWMRHFPGGESREYAICFDCTMAGKDRDVPELRARLREAR